MKKEERILVVYRVNKSVPSNQGIISKLAGQIQAFNNFFSTCDYVLLDDHNILLNEEAIYFSSKKTESLSFKWRYYALLNRHLNKKPYDVIYLRFGLFTFSMLQWLKQIKLLHPDCKLVLEYPTYPYHYEWTGIYGKIALLINQLFKPFITKLIDLSVFMGRRPVNYPYKSLLSTNGIDVSNFPCKKRFPLSETINLIAVGKWQFWHGLDRLIEGIYRYNSLKPSIPVKLKVIGNGPALAGYIKLVSKLDLTSSVSFSGELVGKDLNDQFDLAHVAIGSLASHRKNLLNDSSLKHREYCARGIPFVISSNDPDFPKTNPFVQHISPNEHPVNIYDLVSFYKNLNPSKATSEKMRSHASNELGWNKRIGKILNELN